MKNFEKDLVYYLINRDNYLEKACRVFCDAYSPSQALDCLISYLQGQVSIIFSKAVTNSSADLLLFYIHLEDELNYREMAIFILDFYR